MTKMLARRLAAATFATAAAIGGTTFFAAPASAHSSSANGVAECVPSTGDWKITWTLTNDMDKAVNLTNFVLTPDDPKATKPTSIPIREGKKDGVVKFESIAPNNTTLAKVSYTATWPYNGTVRTVESAPVKFKDRDKCVKPSPSPSPSRSVESSTSPSPSSTASTPSLPVTGSSNTMPMVGAGAGLIVGGAVLLMVLRRRRQVRFTAE